MLRVIAPVAGHSLEVSEVPDPVFSAGLVGPGVAIVPRSGSQRAVAPVSGRLAKLLPHAYVVVTASGTGVLVHLGVDTVHLQGEGFEVLAHEDDEVRAGDAIVRWDPSDVERVGRSPICAVVALDCDPEAVSRCTVGVDVDLEQLLFEVDC